MAHDKFGPSDDLDEWSSKVCNIMNEMLNRSFVAFRSKDAWQPATNVYEVQAAFIVCVELAGLEEAAIDVRCIDDRRLSVSGRREQPRPDPERGALSVHVMEIDEGPFYREIELPDPIDVDRVRATTRLGLLWIHLPRKGQP